MAKKKTTTEESKSKGTKTAPQTTGLRTLFAESDVDWATPRLATGIVPLDFALGGGFGYGRLAEIFGGEASTKTYILYLALIACQKMGGIAILLEGEGSYDPAWFRALGGDPDALIVVSVKTVQQAFEHMKKVADYQLTKATTHICIGWDGIAACATDHLMEKGLDVVDMSKPKVMSQGCELITTAIKERLVCVIATNQIRDSMDKYKPAVTPGGRAWKFHASTRIEMKFDGGKTTNIIYDPIPPVRKEDDPEIIGRRVTAFVEKNKLGPGLRTVELPFYLYENRKHPLYDDTPTRLGYDHVEALFDFYHRGPFRLPPVSDDAKPWDGPRVITQSGAYFFIDARIDPEHKGFYKKDWPEHLNRVQRLLTLPLEGGPGT